MTGWARAGPHRDDRPLCVTRRAGVAGGAHRFGEWVWQPRGGGQGGAFGVQAEVRVSVVVQHPGRQRLVLRERHHGVYLVEPAPRTYRRVRGPGMLEIET
jgi:hypothetical protein